MSNRDENIASFLAALSEMPELWRSLDVRTIAVHTGGEWHNALTSVRIDTRLPDELPVLKDLPTTALVHLRISLDVDHPFRSKLITRFGRC
ncbi:hypothetical protein BH11GEM2_BH11GEM2_30580 [soil metagenome]